MWSTLIIVLNGLVIFFLIQRLIPARGIRQNTVSELKSQLSDKTNIY
nr:hypothetical protein [Bacillus sp. M6-12]